MSTPRPQKHAIEGWFADGDVPALVGVRCASCGTYAFPKGVASCPNPECGSTDLVETPLSRRGRVWSFTTNHYEPPPPYVPPDPFVPYTVAAVELDTERLVVLGQVAGDTDGLRVGDEMELVVDRLFAADDHDETVWKWKRVTS